MSQAGPEEAGLAPAEPEAADRGLKPHKRGGFFRRKSKARDAEPAPPPAVLDRCCLPSRQMCLAPLCVWPACSRYSRNVTAKFVAVWLDCNCNPVQVPCWRHSVQKQLTGSDGY